MRKGLIITKRKLAIITREEYTDFKHYMRKADPKAFVSIAENVHILGRFVDLDD